MAYWMISGRRCFTAMLLASVSVFSCADELVLNDGAHYTGQLADQQKTPGVIEFTVEGKRRYFDCEDIRRIQASREVTSPCELAASIENISPWTYSISLSGLLFQPLGDDAVPGYVQTSYDDEEEETTTGINLGAVYRFNNNWAAEVIGGAFYQDMRFDQFDYRPFGRSYRYKRKYEISGSYIIAGGKWGRLTPEKQFHYWLNSGIALAWTTRKSRDNYSNESVSELLPGGYVGAGVDYRFKNRISVGIDARLVLFESRKTSNLGLKSHATLTSLMVGYAF